MNQPAQIQVLCNSLYASSLSRIGRDRDALLVHDGTLSLIQQQQEDGMDMASIEVDVRIGRGQALQRLMRYSEAKEDFLAVCEKSDLGEASLNGKVADCAYSAVLCSLRQGDFEGAESTLSSLLQRAVGSLDPARRKPLDDIHVHIDANLIGLYGAMKFKWENNQNQNQNEKEESLLLGLTPLKFLQHAASSPNASPVYKWFYAIASNSTCDLFPKDSNLSSSPQAESSSPTTTTIEKNHLLHIASINQSPFDDPALIHLDDKILLHELLTSTSSGATRTSSTASSSTPMAQWPNGYVLPRDKIAFQDYNHQHPDSRWIVKERAGYGSHGNQILDNPFRARSEDNAGDMDKTEDSSRNQSLLDDCISFSGGGEDVLCQRLIDPSLLYHSRKFSIRVYVVYIQNGARNLSQVFLLDQGLAKLADATYEEQSLKHSFATAGKGRTTTALGSEDAYMTNSGRIEGDGMTQYDFESLKSFMDDEYGDGSFIKTWEMVSDSVTKVLRTFLEEDHWTCNDTRTARKTQCSPLFSTVPKILGFDYIIDTDLQPWLMEINRFPGLEARGSMDVKVKSHAIEMAWRLASASARTSCGLSTQIDKIKTAQELPMSS